MRVVCAVIDLRNVFKFENVEAAQDRVTAIWNVPFDLPYLEGHFPSQPIVPAVAIVDASIELLKRTVSPAVSLKGIKTSKFLNPLVPGLKVDIECRRINDQEWSVDWKAPSEVDGHAPSLHLIARLALVI
jgi:3-hydroxymyristoyl/3-hydroxydecanoyl-(acyl carrier protein) dehydratase